MIAGERGGGVRKSRKKWVIGRRSVCACVCACVCVCGAGVVDLAQDTWYASLDGVLFEVRKVRRRRRWGARMVQGAYKTRGIHGREGGTEEEGRLIAEADLAIMLASSGGTNSWR